MPVLAVGGIAAAFATLCAAMHPVSRYCNAETVTPHLSIHVIPTPCRLSGRGTLQVICPSAAKAVSPGGVN
jgi:hypothetical protein